MAPQLQPAQAAASTLRVPVVVAAPAHSGLLTPLTYRSERPLTPGTLVRVPLGRRQVLGIVWDGDALAPAEGVPERDVLDALDALPPVHETWRQLVAFAARYYQRSLGEVALAALPPQLRELDARQLARRLRRQEAGARGKSDASAESATIGESTGDGGAPLPEPATADVPTLTGQQRDALAAIDQEAGPFLLFGVTGSGKTEVYLRAVATLLEEDSQAQALVMVPEINLTPQLQARFVERFGADRVVAMHSGMTPPQRLRSWLAAHHGQARIVLGTRMAVYASMPRLRLIVVDEEHDPSYKQQDGARHSARDLAVLRGRLEPARVLLGSATPSLESWQAAQSGRYRLLPMPERVGAGALPRVRLVDMNQQPRGAVLAPPLVEAIARRIDAGEQSLLFLNRRGYAPVLACLSCDWKSECPHCSAYSVFHKIDRTLRCHHCGWTQRVPRACPSCGNPDIAPVGRGTERLEEHIGELLAGAVRPLPGGGTRPVRIERIDADTTRAKGSLEARIAQVHAGEVDVLVGTQMVTKGHDFRRITLVAAVNADSALFSSDFRAAERLFALLMQAGGRAGRDARHADASELWVQTFSPQHPLFAALRRHDYPAFAHAQIEERRRAAMPPFAFQALLRAEGRSQEAAQQFLQAAFDGAAELPARDRIELYSPVPMPVQRIAGIERAQLLVESASRPALQHFLAAWQPVLHALRVRGVVRWAVDVDPISV